MLKGLQHGKPGKHIEQDVPAFSTGHFDVFHCRMYWASASGAIRAAKASVLCATVKRHLYWGFTRILVTMIPVKGTMTI